MQYTKNLQCSLPGVITLKMRQNVFWSTVFFEFIILSRFSTDLITSRVRCWETLSILHIILNIADTIYFIPFNYRIGSNPPTQDSPRTISPHSILQRPSLRDFQLFVFPPHKAGALRCDAWPGDIPAHCWWCCCCCCYCCWDNSSCGIPVLIVNPCATSVICKGFSVPVAYAT